MSLVHQLGWFEDALLLGAEMVGYGDAVRVQCGISHKGMADFGLEPSSDLVH
jgi:hypothetical protein